MEDAPNQEVITLNVGENENPYRTSRATLQTSTKFKEHILREGQTEYFLDRDHKLFDFIIHYMRDRMIQFPEGFSRSAALKKEAEYFELGDLAEALDNGAGTKQVINVVVPEKQDDTYVYNAPIYDITPIGWTWNDLETILPPVKDVMVKKASICLTRNNSLSFTFHATGHQGVAQSPNEYLSMVVAKMPPGSLQIKVLKPTLKNTVLDILMTEHNYRCTESNAYHMQEMGYVEDLVLCRIKPVMA